MSIAKRLWEEINGIGIKTQSTPVLKNKNKQTKNWLSGNNLKAVL